LIDRDFKCHAQRASIVDVWVAVTGRFSLHDVVSLFSRVQTSAGIEFGLVVDADFISHYHIYLLK
jgi:hypothetical protein